MKTADAVCGPCDTVIRNLKGVAFGPGFIIRATDYNKEFAADSSPTGLVPFLEEAREAIEKKKGVMILEETMQVIAPPEAPRGFQEKVGKALVQTMERFSGTK